MTKSTNGKRKAVAITKFGGIEDVAVQSLSLPEINSDEILVRVVFGTTASGAHPIQPKRA